ncbi:MAG: hypothetical protein FJZ63_06050 [Chlamydiae bacterium]|nr:hypothetical protein [Chlamydiota bacterium]
MSESRSSSFCSSISDDDFTENSPPPAPSVENTPSYLSESRSRITALANSCWGYITWGKDYVSSACTSAYSSYWNPQSPALRKTPPDTATTSPETIQQSQTISPSQLEDSPINQKKWKSSGKTLANPTVKDLFSFDIARILISNWGTIFYGKMFSQWIRHKDHLNNLCPEIKKIFADLKTRNISFSLSVYTLNDQPISVIKVKDTPENREFFAKTSITQCAKPKCYKGSDGMLEFHIHALTPP